MTWGSDLGLFILEKKKEEKKKVAIMSKQNKGKEISDILPRIRFVSVHNKNSWSYRIGLTLLHCVCATTNLHPNQFPRPSHLTTECRPHTLHEPQLTLGWEREGKRGSTQKIWRRGEELIPQGSLNLQCAAYCLCCFCCASSQVLWTECLSTPKFIWWGPNNSRCAGIRNQGLWKIIRSWRWSPHESD